jgi:DNA-binding response OmpR family regulator
MALRVLSVDDSKTIRMIVKKAFSAYEVEMIEAENGEQGLQKAKAEKPDLIVLDITMPVMTGIEMLGHLRADPALKAIPVIMLTAESGKDNVLEIVKMGVQNYIVKPFKGEQLIERAKTVVALKEKEGKPAEDPGKRYFADDGDITILTLPDKISRPVAVEVETFLKVRLKAMGESGANKMILDLSKVDETSMGLIKLIVLIVDKCRSAKVHVRVVGPANLANELKEFAETSEIPVHSSIDAVKGGF